MSLIIKNGTLITASETFRADILVESEKISAIGEDLAAPGAGSGVAPAAVPRRRHGRRLPRCAMIPCLSVL